MKYLTLALLFASSAVQSADTFQAQYVYYTCKQKGLEREKALKDCVQDAVDAIKKKSSKDGEKAQKDMDQFFEAKEKTQQDLEDSNAPFGPLPSLSIDPNLITVMGFGSGAYQAHNLHITASDIFKGAGLFNGFCYSQKDIIQPFCPTRQSKKEAYKKEHGHECQPMSSGDKTLAINKARDHAKGLVSKYESEGRIPPTSNLKESPVYIHTGDLDLDIPPPNQECVKEFYQAYGASVELQHEMKNHVLESAMPGAAIHYVYSKIEGSGIKSSDHVPKPDLLWKENGYLEFFDQRPYIKKALQVYEKAGGSTYAHHHLGDFGYFYYPKACVRPLAKCKFAIVAQPTNKLDETFLNSFGRFASANDIVMVWPSVNGSEGWDSEGWSGSRYNTKDAVHTLFMREIVARMKEPLDPSYDYRVTTAQGALLTNTESKAFTAGLVASLLNLSRFQPLMECAHGSDRISKDVAGMEDALSVLDVNKIVSHFQITVLNLPEEMKDCEQADYLDYHELRRLTYWVADLNSPTYLMKHVATKFGQQSLSTFTTMQQTYMKMLNYMRLDAWAQAGQAYGNMLKQLVGKVPQYTEKVSKDNDIKTKPHSSPYSHSLFLL